MRRAARNLAIVFAAAVVVLLGAAASAEPPGTVLVSLGASWRYLDNGSNQGTAWQAPGFADGSWAQGPAELGYGDGDEATVVNGGPASNHFITTYFRGHFTVTDPASIEALQLQLRRDDGAVIYLNGTEVARSNMPGGAVAYTTPASTAVGGADEIAFFPFSVCPGLLVAGDNVLAVEIHQSGPTSTDVSFDLSLQVTAATPITLVRAPYLQTATPTSTIVRWRTSQATGSRVRYGAAPGALLQTAQVPGCRTDHEVSITGLVPAMSYYYAVGNATQTFAGDDANHHFKTAPVAGTGAPVRVWVIGDSGTCAVTPQGCLDAGAVRDAYLGFAGAHHADVWLMLGDNAYQSGTDTEFTTGLFEVYPSVMRETPVWPVMGNHESLSSDSPTQSGPFFDAFSLPRLGEAGGVASGSEAYFSFDHGNVHFVALDSEDTDRSAPPSPQTNVCAPGQGGAMYQWLCADLAATTQDFIIAFWHHPPYTKGSHNSDNVMDSGGRMTEMRERFLPVLEAYGVDLALTGHSHSYERSVLLDRHYGLSTSYDPGVHGVDTGDGDPAGDGPYTKSVLAAVPHEGAVYAVVGSSSQTSGGFLNYPAMTTSLSVLGSMLIDVAGNQLDATFLDNAGAVRDRFRITKGPLLPACSNGIDDDGDGAIDYPADPGCGGPSYTKEAPQCNDGIDNDGDLLVDLADPGCQTFASNDFEVPPSTCGLGPELALVLPLLGLARRIRSSRAPARGPR